MFQSKVSRRLFEEKDEVEKFFFLFCFLFFLFLMGMDLEKEGGGGLEEGKDFTKEERRYVDTIQ